MIYFTEKEVRRDQPSAPPLRGHPRGAPQLVRRPQPRPRQHPRLGPNGIQAAIRLANLRLLRRFRDLGRVRLDHDLRLREHGYLVDF